MSRIGFVILTHSKPHQIKRLAARLTSMFDAPPIVIHHDFGKCPLDEADFPANVSFVRPHLKTGWAAFSVVKATVQALGQLYRRPDSPDWCAVLSGSCYPTKPAAQILANLTAGDLDAHIDAEPIGRAFQDTEAQREHYRRHCLKYFDLPSVDKRGRGRRRRLYLPHFLSRRFVPYHDGLRSFAGSQWFTVGRRAAAYIAEFQATPAAAALVKHHQNKLFSEESYFQTVLCNAPELVLNRANWVYMDWSERTSHPKSLTLTDLGAIGASDTHFARKIDMDSSADLLDALDRIINGELPAESRVPAAA